MWCRLNINMVFCITREFSKVFIGVTRSYTATTNAKNCIYQLMNNHTILRRRELLISKNFCSKVGLEGLTNENLYSKLSTTPEVAKEIKMILLEYELAKQSNLRVPTQISDTDMEQLLQLNSVRLRQKYFHYLGTKEFVRLSHQKKKEERRKEFEQYKIEKAAKSSDSKDITYDLAGYSLFPRISKQAVHRFHLSRLCHAATFEQPLVFDLSYEDQMGIHQIMNTADQLQMAYAANKRNTEPFDLYFCNFNFHSKLGVNIEKFFPNIHDGNYMITIDERNYLDVFPKDKLIYLTPDAHRTLKNFEADKIYIIGGLVDKGTVKPVSLAKAKCQGIQTARLPLDEHVLWGCGTKSLTLNQVTQILLEWKKTNDWNKAFEFLPKRKLKTPEQVIEENNRKLLRLKKYQGRNSENERIRLKVSSFFKD